MSAADQHPAGPPRDRPAGRGRRAPATLAVVGALVLLEVLVLAAVGLWWSVQLLRGAVGAPGAAVFLVLFAFAVAAVLLASVRALWAGRRIGRAPVATWQLLQGATAVAVLQVTGSALAWSALAASAVVFVLLLTRPVVEHTVP